MTRFNDHWTGTRENNRETRIFTLKSVDPRVRINPSQMSRNKITKLFFAIVVTWNDGEAAVKVVKLIMKFNLAFSKSSYRRKKMSRKLNEMIFQSLVWCGFDIGSFVTTCAMRKTTIVPETLAFAAIQVKECTRSMSVRLWRTAKKNEWTYSSVIPTNS